MSASKEEINQTLRRLHSDFDLLLDNNVISSDLYDQLVEKIPRRYGGRVATTVTYPEPTQSPAPTSAVSDLSSQLHRTSISSNTSPPPKTPERSPAPPPYGLAQAEVLYNYSSNDEGDLNLVQGQRISILEYVNNDWWKGEDQAGQQGIFPSNYVRKLDQQNEKSADRGHGAPIYSQPQPQYPAAGYPGAGYPGGYQQPQYAPQYVQPQQPAPQPTPQPVQEEKHQGKLAAFGKNYGKTFVNATAWGGGMTLGADVINKIF